MIERGDYEFMNRFDANNASEREKILSNPTEKFEVGGILPHIFRVLFYFLILNRNSLSV